MVYRAERVRGPVESRRRNAREPQDLLGKCPAGTGIVGSSIERLIPLASDPSAPSSICASSAGSSVHRFFRWACRRCGVGWACGRLALGSASLLSEGGLVFSAVTGGSPASCSVSLPFSLQAPSLDARLPRGPSGARSGCVGFSGSSAWRSVCLAGRPFILDSVRSPFGPLAFLLVSRSSR